MMCDMANKHTWINERTNEPTDGRTDQPTDGPSDRTNERTSLHYLPFQNEWLVPDYILLPRILAHIHIIHWPYPDEAVRSRVWYLIYLKVKSKRSCSGRLGQLGRQVGASAGLSSQEGLRMSLFSRGYSESLYVSGKLPTYPSPKPTLTLTSHLEQNVALREG